MSEILQYYARRAAEYERIYHYPERQADLSTLRSLVPTALTGASVLELACGTGYWTEVVAPVAGAILATDGNEEVLSIARRKSYPPGRVVFRQLDAYNLPPLPEPFTGGLAAFWWSHVPRERLHEFLAGFHARLRAGAVVVFLDNQYVEGNSTPVSREDELRNTFQTRQLDDGSRYEVLKNFPSPGELRATLRGLATDVRIELLDHYWFMSYRVRA